LRLFHSRSKVAVASVFLVLTLFLVSPSFLFITPNFSSAYNLHSSNNISAPAISVVTTISVGKQPNGIVYDNSSTDLYVPNNSSGTVSVIASSGANLNKVIKTLTVGKEPQSVSYDPKSKEVYVTNYGSSSVSVISGTSVAKTITVCLKPLLAIYDPANGNMYVTNSSVFSTATLSYTPSVIYEINSGTFAVTKISLGAAAFPGLFYDPANKGLYTSSIGYSPTSPTIFVINSSTNAVKKLSTPLGTLPFVIGYSPKNHQVYVELYPATSTVKPSVIALTKSNTIAATIKGVEALSSVYNPSSTDMYFVNATSSALASNKVIVVSSSNSIVKSIGIGRGALFLLYDPANKEVYIMNYASNTTSVISSANSLVATIKDKQRPLIALYNPGDKDVFVLSFPKNTTSTKSIVQVLSSAATPTSLTTVTVGLSPSGGLFDPTDNEGYVTNHGSNSVTVISS
jgi:YVTN family beta-propeller protein